MKYELPSSPGIYKITNLVNGKFYIGLSKNINRRWVEHKSKRSKSNLSLARAFRKYGVENFSIETLEQCSIDLIFSREMWWIKNLSPHYNRNQGGSGNLGFTMPNASKNRLSLAGKAQWARKAEDEKEAFVKNNLTGPKFSHAVSEETRSKLRAFFLGKKHSSETISKMKASSRISMVGNRNGNKPVVQIKNGEVVCYFGSAKWAAEELGISPSHITGALTGREKTAGGYSWEYFKTNCLQTSLN